jgi:anti-sigma factor RsiW
MRYLLGELGPDEQAELDERAFVDDAWEERRDTAADELIDAYLAGALRPEARQRFEVHFLASAAHRERFQLLRDLRSVLAREGAAPSAAPVRRTLVWSAAAAALVAALAALYLIGRSQATEHLVAVATTPPPPIATVVATPVPEETREPAPTRTLTVAVADASRSVAVALRPELRTVQFAIPVPEDGAPSYAVTVRQGAETVWQREDLVPREAGAPIEVGVPANVLAAGGVLSIEGEATRGVSTVPQPVRRWTLRVTRR